MFHPNSKMGISDSFLARFCFEDSAEKLHMLVTFQIA